MIKEIKIKEVKIKIRDKINEIKCKGERARKNRDKGLMYLFSSDFFFFISNVFINSASRICSLIRAAFLRVRLHEHVFSLICTCVQFAQEVTCLARAVTLLLSYSSTCLPSPQR